MKQYFKMLLITLLVLCGCSNTTNKEKETEVVKISDIQQNDINIANDLSVAADKMEQLQSLHMVATTQEGSIFDMNVSGTNYAGTHTHDSSVNGVIQQLSDFEYEKDGVQSTYISYTGKILPYSNNFCPYMISTMANKARTYKDIVPIDLSENYTSIFEITDNGDGTKTIKTIGDEVVTFVLNTDLFVINYTDEFAQQFTADGFNTAVLDYSNSGF